MTPDSPRSASRTSRRRRGGRELQEIKEFLRTRRSSGARARIPKGVLLYRASRYRQDAARARVAGEARRALLLDLRLGFREMFAGVGASRVRDLFEQAKQASPCIVFMDEIDAVGRHRGAGLGGGHDEREQTLKPAASSRWTASR